MPSRYSFRDHDAAWAAAFHDEVGRLRSVFGPNVVAIHHIGSTSVPGLAAKPIIDMMPLVHELTEVDAVTPAMESAGYRAWGEYGLPGRRYFTRDRDGRRTHNIHTYEAGDPDVERHLAFPAYLRAHPEIAAEYEAVKRAAYSRHPDDIDGYMDAKDGWIKAAQPAAIAWWRTID